jgi:hypothetical protein
MMMLWRTSHLLLYQCTTREREQHEARIFLWRVRALSSNRRRRSSLDLA